MTRQVTIYYRDQQQDLTALRELENLLNTIMDDAITHKSPLYVSLEYGDHKHAIDMTLGRPEYSVLTWHDLETPDIAYSKGTVSASENDLYDYAGTPTSARADSAIPVEDARKAAREFFITGQRPNCIEWHVPEP